MKRKEYLKNLILFVLALFVAGNMSAQTNDAVAVYKGDVIRKAFKLNQVDSIVLRSSADIDPAVFDGYFENFKVLSSEGVEGQKLGEKDGVWTVCLNAKGADTGKLKFSFEIGGDCILYANGQEIQSGAVVSTGLDAYGICKPVQFELKKGIKTEAEWQVKAYYFDLPALYINTPDYQPIVSKEDWIENATISLWTTDGKIDTFKDAEGKTQIRGRGNSTWDLFPKKPYTLKLDKKCKMLGMAKDKRWNLLANWMDKTRLRNEVSFALSESADGLAWTPNGKNVELILNGQHVGLYYLCEHIKIAKDRVNITEIDEKSTDLSGGYLLEFDNYYDEVNKFKPTISQLPINVKSPDFEGFDLTYIENYVNTLESKLQSGDKDYWNYMDMDSYIDWWLVYEMAMNTEPPHPKSCHMYKDADTAEDNKMHAGPAWDFDWGTYRQVLTNGWHNQGALWYGYLFQDSQFISLVQKKWREERMKFYAIIDSIDGMASEISASAERDLKMWWDPYKGTSYDEYLHSNEEYADSYPTAVSKIKSALYNRLQWMDTQLYVPKDYTITASSADESMGTVSPASQTVKDGSNVSVTASANSGYTFENWTENGTEIGTDATLVFTNVQADHDVVANFRPLVTKTITASVNNADWGTVSFSSKQVVVGADVTITALAKAGYRFVNWTEGGSEIGTTYTLTLTNVTEDHAITANFEKDPDFVPGEIQIEEGTASGEGDAKPEM